MSICSYNKNQKSTPINTPTNSSTKTLKDERPGSSNFPSKGPARRQQQTSFESRKGHGGNYRAKNWKNHRLDNSKKDQRFEKYASGGSFVSADGRVKDGSKKVSLNHLLNFKFEPRHLEDVNHSHQTVSKRYGNRVASSRSNFNKERFLLANSRFVAKEDGDYSIHSTDPDAPIPWKYVEKVLLHVDDGLSCPICLYPPTVPKITKCGHVYCWSCILHYLALDERGKSVRDCPICGVDIRKSDLRSVSFLDVEPLQIGGAVKMNLMFRKSHSLIPRRINEMDDAEMTDLNKHALKIEQFSPLQVLQRIVEPELDMLKAKLCVETDELEKEFIHCAIQDCELRQTELLDQVSGCENKTSEDVSNCHKELTSESTETPVNDDNTYYFYQIEDGRNVFLDGLNVKCLLKEFSSFKNCPPILEASLLHVESFVMTEDLRKRHKYLSHLPLSCEYKIVELDLKSPLLSRDTLDEFQEAIKRRSKIRQRKEKLENDSKRRAEMAEQRKFQSYLRDNSFVQAESEFFASSANVAITKTSESVSFPVGSLTSESSDLSLSPPMQATGSMSFAEKLRTGESSSQWPRTMKVKATSTVSDVTVVNANDSDCDDDPSYHAPAYQFSFCDALSASLDGQLSVPPDVAEAPRLVTGGSGKSRGKKQKKRKQKLLFSTSAHMPS